MVRLAAAGILSLAILAASWPLREARACSLVPAERHLLDPAEEAADGQAPGAAGRVSVRVKRGHGAQQDGCGGLGTDSCADMGSVRLQFDAAPDDRTPAARMGYRLEVVEGEAPEFLFGALADHGVRASALDGTRVTLWLDWVDGDSAAQEPLDFVLRVTPVDLAGNLGPPVEAEVHDPGSGGCAAGPGGAGGLLPVALVALSALLRSRKPR